ncbi:MAG: protein kinase [Chloroflexi bacterium]|nr:protein kinase [Chloroflexota bacterium]
MLFKDGENVGPYRVIGQLGQGGMATVFKAYHAALDRYVALKVLHPAFLVDPNFLARFEREAKVVAKLDHPNIIPIYDFSEHEGHPYLVMKYVKGETLKARLTASPLTQEDGLPIIEAVGAALAYAHKQGILHRDIKPSNVMLSDENQIYLTDFGLARIAAAGESTLSSDMMLGTPQYISPEQAMGKRDLDEGTDIYSFGVLVYELVVGQVPFSADTPFSVIHDHIYSPLPMPRSINPMVPEGVERFLLKALSKEREDRFADVNEMIEAFKTTAVGGQLPEVWSDPATSAPTAVADASAPAADALDIAAAADAPTIAPEVGLEDLSEDKPRRRLRWWYAIPIVLTICFCLIILSQADKDKELPGGAATDQPEVTEPVLDQPPPDSPPEEVASEPPPPEPRSNALFCDIPAGDSPEGLSIEEAQVLVDEDPSAFAYLDLAVALLDAGQDPEARAAFETAGEIAGEDWEFFATAGAVLSARNEWLLAFAAYIQAFEFGAGNDSPGLINQWLQAAYHSASDPSAGPIFSEIGLQLDRPNENEAQFPMLFDGLRVAYARFLFHNNQPREAENIIQPMMTRENGPPNPIAGLVQAEIFWHRGQIVQAAELLERLADPNSPNRVDNWIFNRAEDCLGTFD